MSPDVLEHWMEEAILQAEQALKHDEVPIGAVLVNGGQIIGAGYNVRESLSKTTGHAEIQALESFNQKARSWRLPPGTSLFVTAEPCLMCTGALLAGRISHIYFGCSDTRGAGLSHIQPFIAAGKYDHQPQTITGGVLRERCASLLSNYFKSKR